MKFAPILPPMKPSAPAASNCADGAQHTAYRVHEAMFKLRLLTRSINDDAENLLTLSKCGRRDCGAEWIFDPIFITPRWECFAH